MWNKIPLIHTYTYLKVDNMPTIGFEIKRKCKVCGKVFVAKNSTATTARAGAAMWLGSAKEMRKQRTQGWKLLPNWFLTSESTYR